MTCLVLDSSLIFRSIFDFSRKYHVDVSVCCTSHLNNALLWVKWIIGVFHQAFYYWSSLKIVTEKENFVFINYVTSLQDFLLTNTLTQIFKKSKYLRDFIFRVKIKPLNCVKNCFSFKRNHPVDVEIRNKNLVDDLRADGQIPFTVIMPYPLLFPTHKNVKFNCHCQTKIIHIRQFLVIKSKI